MRFRPALIGALLALVSSACGPSIADIERRIDEKVGATVAAMPTPVPTVTPVTFPTPLPTATPVQPPTPVPTPTAVRFPTPLPTPTPVAIPTPLPTATPVTFPDPLPTATPYFTPTPFRWDGAWPVVRVTVRGGLGNGVLISSTEVLTAYHVVRGNPSVTLTLPASVERREETRRATIRGYNSADDVALLEIDRPFSPDDFDYAVPLSVGSDICAGGSDAVDDGDVVVVETTGNNPNVTSVYRLWGRRFVGVGNEHFQADIGVAEGVSGSPIYDGDGRTIVGMVVRGGIGLSSLVSPIALDGCIIADHLSDLRAGVRR